VVLRRETTVGAAPPEVWAVVSDPAQLARWWPGVARVEAATPESWTTVLASPRGKVVRADYTRVKTVEGERVQWSQQLAGTPFERILASSSTEVSLEPAEPGATKVGIALVHQPRGWARFAPLQFRSAAARQVNGALDGLSALFGGARP
jgi:uncharacterized protein YndB with AHSA1/START domain